MERIYSDASYRDGCGGMAVVAPIWTLECAGYWLERWDIKTATDKAWEDKAVFYSSCMCQSSNDAEKRAIGMAFLLAYDMIGTNGEKVEVVSDSLIVLDWIMNRTTNDPILEALCNLWQRRMVVLAKVKGHGGNTWNELADKWAKHGRANLYYGRMMQNEKAR